MKLYESTNSEITRQNILKELSKIVNLHSENAQINIQNNLPQTPVQIVFKDDV